MYDNENLNYYNGNPVYDGRVDLGYNENTAGCVFH